MKSLATTILFALCCLFGVAQFEIQSQSHQLTDVVVPSNGINGDNFGGCAAGAFSEPLQFDVCPDNFVTAHAVGATLSGSPGYGFNFLPQTGATGGVPGGFSLSVFDEALFIFDGDLNGSLSNAGYGPMLGEWEIQGFAFTNPADPSGSICEFTTNSLLVTFLAAGPQCEGCEAGEFVDASFQIVPDGQSAEVEVSGLFIPSGGGYAYNFVEGVDGSGGLAGGFNITNSTYLYSFDADLNGLMSANALPPLSGAWLVTGFAHTDPNDAAGSLCDLTSESVIVYFDNGNVCPTIIDGSADFLPYDPIFLSVTADNPDCCDLAWDGNCEAAYQDLYFGCTYSNALNFSPLAVDDDSSCEFSCVGDLDGSTDINTSDLLILLSVFDSSCE